jgi:hypothetical protein
MLSPGGLIWDHHSGWQESAVNPIADVYSVKLKPYILISAGFVFKKDVI